jgi:ubiquinone/menaquinone biosynthesis C-methylase UbiE
MPGGTDPAKLKAETTYNLASDHFDDAPLHFWERYGRKTVDRLALTPGASVLDVGCGTGASALWAAAKVAPEGQVIGVDLAERLLDIARRKARQRNLHNVEFRKGDMGLLTFRNGSFDAVVCVFAVFFVTDMVSQVAELWRLVRPGGQLAITTWGPRMWEPASAAWWAAVQRYRPDLVPASSPWARVTSPGALHQLLVESGIADVQIVAEDGSQELLKPEDWWTVVLGSGYRWTVEQMDANTAACVREANLQTLRHNHVKSFETNVLYATAMK